ncbi:MAG: indole-3-glycerol phosphate synthase TrpC, partial [Armatimonadetes bacterium]|nr:indole-3-glycerol phosphate synthase TrpC [Armatimonadota bacterium]
MTILQEIFDFKRSELDSLKASRPLAEVVAAAQDAGPTRGFMRALVTSAHSVSLIAEVKKASPVKGTLRADFHPVAIAQAYERAGADCLSVLTDVPYFQGSPDFLVQCREATSLPVLRKDFTTDAYHVYEARALGADAVLLIVNGLSQVQLREYRELAESLGMDVLVEAHTLAEAETAMESGAKLLGVNNRDLETFETNIEATEEIAPLVAGRATVVSESALRTSGDVARVSQAGARSVLIGSAFSL